METVTDLDKNTIEGLKKIARMNHDAAKGFTEAADQVKGEGYESLFRIGADERKRFADELATALSMSDVDAPTEGTALGAFHRSWLNVRSALNGGDESVVLAEAIRGESALIDDYEEVLKEAAGSPLNPTLHRHLAAVREMRGRMEALKDSAD